MGNRWLLSSKLAWVGGQGGGGRGGEGARHKGARGQGGEEGEGQGGLRMAKARVMGTWQQ